MPHPSHPSSQLQVWALLNCVAFAFRRVFRIDLLGSLWRSAERACVYMIIYVYTHRFRYRRNLIYSSVQRCLRRVASFVWEWRTVWLKDFLKVNELDRLGECLMSSAKLRRVVWMSMTWYLHSIKCPPFPSTEVATRLPGVCTDFVHKRFHHLTECQTSASLSL